MFKKDGHIHTHFCPHGTKDSFREYIEKAISLGFKEISFTEHAPLPDGFIDTTPTHDSAMSAEQLELYFAEIQSHKEKYKDCNFYHKTNDACNSQPIAPICMRSFIKKRNIIATKK